MPATVVVVVADGDERVVAHLHGARPDLRLVDALGRLALTARRHGWQVRIRDASDDLLGLLELVGLAGVLALEPRRQPEVGE